MMILFCYLLDKDLENILDSLQVLRQKIFFLFAAFPVPLTRLTFKKEIINF